MRLLIGLCSLFVNGDAEKLPTLLEGKVSIPMNDLKVAFYLSFLLSGSGLIET
jgi:hypothetical protein